MVMLFSLTTNFIQQKWKIVGGMEIGHQMPFLKWNKILKPINHIKSLSMDQMDAVMD